MRIFCNVRKSVLLETQRVAPLKMPKLTENFLRHSCTTSSCRHDRFTGTGIPNGKQAPQTVSFLGWRQFLGDEKAGNPAQQGCHTSREGATSGRKNAPSFLQRDKSMAWGE
eukprot:EG_transcript_15663